MATVSACCSFGTLGGLEVNYGLRSPMPLRKLFILYLNISSIALNLYFISMHCGHAVLLFFMGFLGRDFGVFKKGFRGKKTQGSKVCIERDFRGF